MKYAQMFLLFLHAVGLLTLIYRDINGRSAKPPEGFSGVVVSLVIFGLVTWVQYVAGMYSQLF